jgi:phosphate/phosphite/phosphonate ABC transporter binding protein
MDACRHSGEIAFGLMWQKRSDAVGQEFGEFVAWLSRAAGVPIKARSAASYEELDKMVMAGDVGLAWVPPIVYLKLERARAVEPLVTHTRAAGVTYESVLIVHVESSIRALDALRGTRAAWVDPWSAAGYVLPRIKLATLGMDPRETFAEEKFHGSHDAAVRAVLERTADVAGTYARRNAEGNLVRAGWTEMPEAGGRVHVLTSFGPIPSDLIVAHRTLDAKNARGGHEGARRGAQTKASARSCGRSSACKASAPVAFRASEPSAARSRALWPAVFGRAG